MRILLFILSIPFIAAFGHDLYINYYLDEEKLSDLMKFIPNIKDFRMSDVGWIWKEYAATSMEVVKDTISASTWDNIINPFLMLPTIWVTGAPLLAALLIHWGLKFARGENPINFQLTSKPKESNQYSVYKGDKKKSMKFKRGN